VLRETAFPEWVPQNILGAAKRMAEADATAQLQILAH